MAIIAKRGGSGGGFEPVSEGLHPAVCWAVVDCGIQQKTGAYPGEAHQVYLGFEVLDASIEFEKDGQRQVGPMRIGITVTNSLHEKSKLRRFTEKWRGKAFSEEELDGFDVSKLAGQPCQLLVVHSHKGDKVYANIENILAWPKGVAKPAKPDSLLIYDLSAPARDWERVPPWLQERVTARLADNWEEFNAQANSERAVHQADVGADFNDDIPF